MTQKNKKKFVCIHGHFYQPPRENPWLEAVELQDSAYPSHDWNERITAECYAPNSAARILDYDGRIVRIVNNYSRINFNFGPTLLSWMASHQPEVYQAILHADKRSQELFKGHGSAIAQAYNHMIMPLANSRDKYTQILWGIKDFEFHFQRFPEGMWLPETAVDLETLDIMADLGIRYTVLAPNQAAKMKHLNENQWHDVKGDRIDPRYPYIQRLPSGRDIALFFYDGPIAEEVAFKKLLANGEHFAARLIEAFSDETESPQLVHIATDGETYGHHHRHGDMALAYAIHHINQLDDIEIINYGKYLEDHPPDREVQIFENSSWSCAHGVERWRSDCGCHTGMNPNWHQKWRQPLRNALDYLRNALTEPFEKTAQQWLKDPWQARHDYIEVINDRSPPAIQHFLQRHQKKELSEDDKIHVLKLMELQRNAMLMYTSCGWFFDEISGIESTQVIQYAGRAIQLAQQLFEKSFEPEFLSRLKAAQSNIQAKGDGKQIYNDVVVPMRLDLEKVMAHYAISSLFMDYQQASNIYCYQVNNQDYQAESAGKAQMAMGQAELQSEITLEKACFQFGVLHYGNQEMNCALRHCSDDFQEVKNTMLTAFQQGDFATIHQTFDTRFTASRYTLNVLFRDQQRYILGVIMQNVIDEAEGMVRHYYDNHAVLMRYLGDLHIPLPKILLAVANFVLNQKLKEAIQQIPNDMAPIKDTLREIKHLGIDFEKPDIELTLQARLTQLMNAFYEAPDQLEHLGAFQRFLELLPELGIELDLWREQNCYYALLHDHYPDKKQSASKGDKEAQKWCEAFEALGDQLNININTSHL